MDSRLVLRRMRCRGVSLPELLVVIAVLALIVMVTVPIAARRLHEAKLRSAASEFVVVLRAARMIAVSKGIDVTVSVNVDPDNRYEYTDAEGKVRRSEMPVGVRIDPTSSGDITFSPNGSIEDAATTVIETNYSKTLKERWSVETSLPGVTRMSREYVDE